MDMLLRTFDLLAHIEQHYADSFFIAAKEGDCWKKQYSTAYRAQVDAVSKGLLAIGIKKGDKVVSVSNNRPEWNFLDFGLGQLGAVHVPIYPTISTADYKHILWHSEAQLIVVSSASLYQKIKPIADELGLGEVIFTFDAAEGLPHWSAITEKSHSVSHEQLNAIRNAVSEDDLFSIVYTSGTTGTPKGVMLSHKNFMSNALACTIPHPIDTPETALSFLPLCHVLERMVNYLYHAKGISIYYAESVDKIAENLQEVKPNTFVTVPRLLEKVYDKIIAKGTQLRGIKRVLFFWAVNLGLKYEFDHSNSAFYTLQLKLANKLVFSKWREALGGQIGLILVGGAAIQERLMRVFNAAGIMLREGYGLSETSPVIAVSRVHWPEVKVGAVGKVLEGLRVKIAEDGEILMKGPSLMLGYYKDKAKTQEVIDSEGWFHTGDIGELDEHMVLKITDRKKEMFKLSGGKYVAPQVIENKFKESIFIEQIIVLGADQKYTAALIAPNYDFLRKWCAKHDINLSKPKDLIRDKRILARFDREVNKFNKQLGQIEQIKRFRLVPDTWTSEGGELSPTQKLKRKFVKGRYVELIRTLWD